MNLPLDQILPGDSLSLLDRLPEASVDLVFADPPYNLQLKQELWRPDQTHVDAVDDSWDKFDDFEHYDQFTRLWLSACRRVLKDTGTLWVIGTYHNIYRIGKILQDLDYWILNDVVWIKCLSGDTELFAKINGQPIISTIKDLVRIINSTTVELPSYDIAGNEKWIELTGWKKLPKTNGIRVELDDGEVIECSKDHSFPVAKKGKVELIQAHALQAEDAILTLGKLSLPESIQSSTIDEKFGEFIGWYIAEGSLLSEEKGILFSLAAKEHDEASELIKLIRDKFGVNGRIHIYDNSLSLVFPGRFMIELVKRFVRGNNAKTKRLARESLWHGDAFLRGVLQGYLKGDGHWDSKNQRWRLGLARNKGLISDLRVICRILGYKICTSDGLVPYKDTKVQIFRGSIRENADDKWSLVKLEELGLQTRGCFSFDQEHSLKHLRTDYKIKTRKSNGEMGLLANQVMNGHIKFARVKRISKSNLKTFYDLSVSGNHTFALSSGLLTHNSNPMPNFRGVRFTNAHETLLWAQKVKGAKYTFNHHSMKALNDDLQMRSDWLLPLCTGRERLKVNGEKAHATQKPEGLLYRILLASTNPGDLVLDPFFGTGTTGAVAKKLGRHYIGIERDREYIRLAKKRIAAVEPAPAEALTLPERRGRPRVPFGALLEAGLLKPGQTLTFVRDESIEATILANGHIRCNGVTGSIHAVAKSLINGAPVNGWDVWLYTARGRKLSINTLRQKIQPEGNVNETTKKKTH